MCLNKCNYIYIIEIWIFLGNYFTIVEYKSDGSHINLNNIPTFKWRQSFSLFSFSYCLLDAVSSTSASSDCWLVRCWLWCSSWLHVVSDYIYYYHCLTSNGAHCAFHISCNGAHRLCSLRSGELLQSCNLCIYSYVWLIPAARCLLLGGSKCELIVNVIHTHIHSNTWAHTQPAVAQQAEFGFGHLFESPDRCRCSFLPLSWFSPLCPLLIPGMRKHHQNVFM